MVHEPSHQISALVYFRDRKKSLNIVLSTHNVLSSDVDRLAHDLLPTKGAVLVWGRFPLGFAPLLNLRSVVESSQVTHPISYLNFQVSSPFSSEM